MVMDFSEERLVVKRKTEPQKPGQSSKFNIQNSKPRNMLQLHLGRNVTARGGGSGRIGGAVAVRMMRMMILVGAAAVFIPYNYPRRRYDRINFNTTCTHHSSVNATALSSPPLSQEHPSISQLIYYEFCL